VSAYPPLQMLEFVTENNSADWKHKETAEIQNGNTLRRDMLNKEL